MGVYSNILSRDHVLVVILAWCSSRFVWAWKILEYLGIPSVGFIGPSLRLEGISAAVIKGMMLVAILLKTCFSRLILGFYQAYTRLSKSRGGLLRGRKVPAVPCERDVPGGFRRAFWHALRWNFWCFFTGGLRLPCYRRGDFKWYCIFFEGLFPDKGMPGEWKINSCRFCPRSIKKMTSE